MPSTGMGLFTSCSLLLCSSPCRALGCCGPCGLAVECGDKVGVVSSGRGSDVGSTEEIGGKGVEEVARGGDEKGLNVQVSEEVVGGKEEGVGVVGGGRGSLVSSGWLDQYSVVSEEELSKISITSLDFKVSVCMRPWPDTIPLFAMCPGSPESRAALGKEGGVCDCPQRDLG